MAAAGAEPRAADAGRLLLVGEQRAAAGQGVVLAAERIRARRGHGVHRFGLVRLLQTSYQVRIQFWFSA